MRTTWAVDGGVFRLAVQTLVDVDAMPGESPYTVFGKRRDEIGPGPVTLRMALAMGAGTHAGVARAWRSTLVPPLDAFAVDELLAMVRPGVQSGQEVLAPFITPVGILAIAGLLPGPPPPYAEGPDGPGGMASYPVDRDAGRSAIADILGAEGLERLDALSTMGWWPNASDTHKLVAAPRHAAEAAIEAGKVWPFLRQGICAAIARDPCLDRVTDVAVAATDGEATPAHLRRMQGAEGVMDTSVLRVACRLPVDWLPMAGDAAGWETFSDVARATDQVASHARVDPASLLRDSRGRWDGYARRMAATALPLAEDPTLDRALAHVVDMSLSFERTLLRPALAITGTPADPRYYQVQRLLVGDGAMGSLVRRIARHGSLRQAMSARLRATSPHVVADISWPAHLPRWTDPATGLSFVPLVDEGELRDEGRHGEDRDGRTGLSHCVGDYGMPCASGAMRIVSVRRGTPEGFERVSTAEIAWSPEGHGPVVRQHAARGNGTPSDDAGESLRRYVGAHVPVDPPVRVPVGTGLAGLRKAGYDTTVGSNVELALELWHPILPRRLRAETLEGFVGAVMAALAPPAPPRPRGPRPPPRDTMPAP